MALPSRTVLIVDDFPEDRELYRSYLLGNSEYLYTVLEAELAQQGLEKCQQHPPDAILLDYQMPDMDGLAFLAQLQATPQQSCLPVIMVIASGNEAIAVQAIKAGAEDYLVKGQITPERLNLSVNRAIETVRLRTQLQHLKQTEAAHRENQQLLQLAMMGAKAGSWSWDLATGKLTWSAKTYDLHGLDPASGLPDYENWYNSFLHPDDRSRVNATISRVIEEHLPNLEIEFRIIHPQLGIRWLQSLGSLTFDEQGKPVRLSGINLDITERKQAEQTSERLQLVLEATRVGVYDWNATTNEVIWTPENEILLGYEPGTPNRTYQEWAARVHPEDLVRVELTLQTAITQGQKDYQSEHRIIWPDGSVHWHFTLGWLTIEQGQLVQMVGILLDISDRKQAELALKESETRLKLAYAVTEVGVWDWNVNSNSAVVSEEYCNLYGLDPRTETVTLEQWLSYIHPNDRSSAVELVNNIIQKQQNEYNIDFRILRPDGIRWVTSKADIFHDHNGNVVRLLGNVLDITERKQAEIALQESEARFRLLADSAPVLIWVTGISGCEFVNRAYLDFLGVELADVQEWRAVKFVHPDDETTYMGTYWEAFNRQERFEAQLRFRRADGEYRWMSSVAQPRYNTTGDVIGYVGCTQDISDLKQTQFSLEQSKETIRQQLQLIEAIYISAPIGLGFVNTDLIYTKINQHLADINGFSISEHIGRPLREMVTQMADQVVPLYRQVIETGEPVINLEMHGTLANQPGVQRDWLVNFYPLFSTDHRVLGVNAVVQEITERKRAQLALEERERQFTTLAEASPSGIFKYDSANNCIYVNRRWCEITGQPPEAALGMGWVQTLHPDDRDSLAQAWLEWSANAKEGEIYQKQGRCLRPDGIVTWFICQAIPEINSEGNVVGYIGTLTDITESKHIEEALRQSEERYRCLAELIPQLVWTASPEGKLLDVNQRFLEFTGLVLNQVPEPLKNLLVHPEDLPMVAQLWNEALQQGTYYQAEGRIRRADGLYRWHLNQATPQKNEQGQIVKWFGTLTDIEAQKQLESERDRLLELERTAREAAERANRIKDEFLAILSHELRSPLNPILGWSKLLQSRKFDETTTAEALATIERNAKLQTQLIDDLLDVAKILRGKLSMNVAPVNLAVVIESAIDTVRTAATAKSILLHPVLLNIGQVSGDSNRLQQIVWNLLSNAIKFTPKGGRVEIRLQPVDNQAEIIVSDTGIGINPNFLPYIFKSFLQEDVSVTRKYGGLGLGLSIVRQLVEAHGGTITADSPGEGLGATFTVQLPLLVGPEIKPTDELPKQTLDATGIRVLTVDDDPDARELLTVVLTEYGAEVLTVASAAEVLANLESFQPDVLVSDIGMPEVDGYSLIQQIRTLTPEQGGEIPAIALTAYARVDDHQRALTSGYQRHVTKPFDPEELVQAVVALVQTQLNHPIAQNDSVKTRNNVGSSVNS